jgi:hypothetical protein
MRRLISVALGCALLPFGAGCPTPEDPGPVGVQVGTVVGEVFIEEGSDTSSVAGAKVEVYGHPATAVTEEGKNFVLEAIPIGTHRVTITHTELGRATRFDATVSTAFQTVIIDAEDTTLGRAATVNGTLSVADGSTVGTKVYLVGGNADQQADVGDDGSYSLTNLPTGPAEIAFSKTGHETVVVEMDLGEGEQSADDVSLATASGGDGCINSSVKRVEDTVHEGITVLLNGGEKVVGTDANGNYSFCDLGPGLYSIQAKSPGFKTMELASVALNSGGEVFGLVAGYLTPGSDDDGADRVLQAFIDSPGPNTVFEEGFAVPLIGRGQDGAAPLADGQLEWFRAPQDDATNTTSLGTGRTLNVPDMPVGGWIISLVGTASDGATTEPVSVVITVNPFQAAARGLFVEIDSPLSNTTFESGVEISFIASGEDRGAPLPDPAGYEWSYVPQSDPTATPTSLGTGSTLNTTLPVGSHIVSVEGVASDGARTPPSPVVVTVIPFDYSLTLSIDEPADNQTFTEGTTIQFRATADTTRSDVTVTDADVSWGYRARGSMDALAALNDVTSGANTGRRIDSIELPVGDWEVHATISLDGGAGTLSRTIDAVIVPLTPDFTPQVVSILPGDDLAPIEVGPNEFTLDIFRGQVSDMQISVQHPTEGELAGSASWMSDTGIAFVGPVADFRTLPVGTHAFTISVQDSLGNVTSATLTITVIDFVFSVAVEAPRLSGENPTGAEPPPYFTEFGLPLRAGTILHPYQQSFQTGQVKWFLVDTGNGTEQHIASGLTSRTFLAPPGQGTLRLEITDNAGNVASATTEYVLQDITFSVFMVEPIDNTSILEGESIDASISYEHTLVEVDPMNVDPGEILEADLEVRYFSSIDGQLTDTNGNDVFTVGDQPTFDGLTFGSHQLTASVRDGQGRIASASRTVLVRSPGVAGTLVSPQSDGLVLLPGVSDVTFDVAVSNDSGVTPKFRWRIDGQEFPAGWDDYGSDEYDPARTSIALGTFDPGVAPFNGGLFTPGSHAIEFFARLDEVDTQFGGNCVNIPQKAVCVTFSVFVPQGNPDVCTGGETTRDIVGVENWSDVKRLNCDIDVEAGSRLVIAPGTRIIVEPGRSWDMELRGGELTIGAANAAEVVFEVQSATPIQQMWEGIYVNTSGSTVNVDNATFRHGYYVLNAGANYGTSTAHLSNVTADTMRHALVNVCPNTLEGLTVRNHNDWAINEGAKRGCPTNRTYDGLLIENGERGIDIAGSGDVFVTNSVFRNMAGPGLWTDDGTLSLLEVRDSVFDNVSDASSEGAIEMTYSCRRTHVYDSEFRNSYAGIYYTSHCQWTRDPLDRIRVNRSLFVNNNRAIFDQAYTDLPLRVHASYFKNNSTHIYLDNTGQDIDLQGNWMGGTGDVTEPGGVLHNVPPGVSPNLPRIHDYRDTAADARVARVDNPLRDEPDSVASLPHIVVRHPEQTGAYSPQVSDGCLPLQVEALDLGDVQVLQPSEPLEDNLPDAQEPTDPDAVCAFYRIDDVDVPDDPGREHMGYDGDGCYTDGASLGNGEYALALDCVLKASGRLDRHIVRFLVDNDAVQGRLWRQSTTWAGDITVSGDVFVPQGHSLTIAPGAVVSVSGGDNLRYARYPHAGTDNNAEANANFGSRGKPDFWVEGTMTVGEVGQARATIEGVGNVQARGAWGGLRVWKTGRLDIVNADLSGADTLMNGYYNVESATAPSITIDDATLDEINVVFRGVCPTTFRDVDATGVGLISQLAFCKDAFTMENASFIGAGASNNDTALIYLDTYEDTGANLQVLLSGVTIDKGYGTRRGDIITVKDSNFGSIVIDGGYFKDFRRLVALGVWNSGFSFQLEVTNSYADNFAQITNTWSGDRYTSVLLDSNAFVNGGYIVADYNNGVSMTITNNRIEDLDKVFYDLRLGNAVTTLLFNGNHVERVNTVLDSQANGSSGQTHTLDFTGNNLIDVAFWLHDLRDYNLGTQTVITDMSGNYFGTTDTATIEALINDVQADGGATMVGLTDYGTPEAQPVVVTVPDR